MSSGAVANNNAHVQEAIARAQLAAAAQSTSSSSSGQKRTISDTSNDDLTSVPSKKRAGEDPSNESIGGGRKMDLGQETVLETIEIPDSVVGLVIGRGGEQISAIQQQTGCRVQMAPSPTENNTRFCTLQGTRSSVNKAREMISEVITRSNNRQSTGGGGTTPTNVNPAAAQAAGGGAAGAIPIGCIQETVMIPGQKCGLIIGRNGDTIKHLQESLQVKMLLIQESQSVSSGPKPLLITGTPDHVAAARRTIENIINSEDGRVSIAKSVGEVIVPRASVGIIIGKGGETIKRLGNESGCKIQFKPDEDPGKPDRCATLHGTPEQINRATRLISDLLRRSNTGGAAETFMMHVPANKTGLVIGKGGDTIKQICNESGAHVELSRDPPPNPSEKVFIIKGTPSQIHNAQHIIRIKVGDIAPGTPVPVFTGSAAIPQVNPYAAAQNFDAYGQWNQQNGGFAGQNDAWSYYQQQQAAVASQAGGGNYGVFQQGGGGSGGQQSQPQGGQQSGGGAGQPDYSAQWAEYYRKMGMPEKAAMVEAQAKAAATGSTAGSAPGTGGGDSRGYGGAGGYN